MFVIKAAESDIAAIGDLNPELSHQHCFNLAGLAGLWPENVYR